MNPVIIPITVTRCPSTRTGDCWLANNCARALAPLESYRPSQDYTQEAGWGSAVCAYFLPAAAYRARPAPPSPTIHEAPRGFA